MKLDLFFKSRLARRFFTMFILSALIPVIALSVVTYSRTSRQLHDQAVERLRRSAKAHGLFIVDRLIRADNQLQIIQTTVSSPRDIRLGQMPVAVAERSQAMFCELALFHNEEAISFWGSGVPAGLTEAVRRLRFSDGEVFLVTAVSSLETEAVMMLRRVEETADGAWYLAGTLNPDFLWGVENGTHLPPSTEFCVKDNQGTLLYSSVGPLGDSEQLVCMNSEGDLPELVELSIHGQVYQAVSWAAFLKQKFRMPFWTITVMEPREYILQPLANFQTSFPLILIVAVCVVILLSSRAIQKSLQPIESLMEGARNVARQHFDYRVTVESKDEFRELAGAFNTMSVELDMYFKDLTARADMDHIILSVLDDRKIIHTGLEHMMAFFRCQTVAIGIIQSDDLSAGRLFIASGHGRNAAPTIQPFRLLDEERRLMASNRNWVNVEAASLAPTYLKFLRQEDVRAFVILPIWIREQLFALVALGTTAESEFTPKEFAAARRFCDHLAVAFSNTNLLVELKELNLGALMALARTVDAKSSWTAGHSHRVTQLAVQIGSAMGLSQNEQDDLQRAGLLHDIGKIGVTSSILDKNGKLTAEEFALVQKHPGLGAEIMRPIKAYARILPIVEQHHEKYDGSGYPHGLSGHNIHPLARIIAVADSFDAMVSDRPYRKGLAHEKALQIIRSEAGHQFDPAVVEIFVEMENWMLSEHPSSRSMKMSPESDIDRLALISSTPADGFSACTDARS